MSKSVTVVLSADDLLVVQNSFCVQCYSARGKKRNTIYRPMFTPLSLNLSCSLVSALTDMAPKCHLQILLEITDGKLHPLLRQGQCYMDEGQSHQCSDSSASIGASSARSHVSKLFMVLKPCKLPQ